MKKHNLFVRFLCLVVAIQLAIPVPLWADLTINAPTFPTTNSVQVTLSGTISTNAHIILWTPEMPPGIAGWNRLTTGTVGQTSFTFTLNTNAVNFFGASIAPVSTPTVATPSFSVSGGTYSLPTNVVIACATAGARIYYTTNGSTPTVLNNLIVNGGSVYLDRITTLKAKAFEANYNDSSVASATYNINSGPLVLAGSQQTLTTGSTTLAGFTSDDGLTGGGTKFTNWAKISGPGSVSFGNSHQTNSSATFGSDGIYVLQLAVSDGQYTNASAVTIAVNPPITVFVTAPANGASYTVPTNLLLQATASCASGSITQLLFYANSAFVGEATGSPLSFNWRSVPAGSLALTAVAITDDPNNFSLASSPVNITVNWPTNIGQVTIASTELQIPVAGLPISVNRQYDSRSGVTGSFGANARLDYESIKIEKNASLSTGWKGKTAGFVFSVLETSTHSVVVHLSDSEAYYFRPIPVFKPGDTTTYNGFQPPRYSTGVRGRVIFQNVGSAQGKLELDNPSNMGYDDGFLGWNNVAVNLVQSSGGSAYDPGFDKYTFTASDGTKYRFNTSGGLGVKTDRNGNSLTFSSGGIVHSSGKQISFTRDGNNFITEIYDPIALDTSGSPVLKYLYDASGNVTNMARLIVRSPATYENTYYGYTNTVFTNNITSLKDPRGVVTARYIYDSSGRLSTQYDAFSLATTYQYDLTNKRLIVTDRLANSTIKNFTDAGDLASVQDATGAITSYQYDASGRKIAETDPVGETTTFGYDANDQLTASTNALNLTVTASYNSFGEPTVTTDARGNSTYYTYDAAGNLLTLSNALGIVTACVYDAQGNRTAETNAVGLAEQATTLSAYDEYGNLTNVTVLDAAGTTVNSVGYSYDLNGNKLTQTKSRTLQGGGNETILDQWNYDAANRMTSHVDPLSHTNTVSYNGLGRVSATVDVLGRTNSFSFDAAGSLTNSVYPDGLSESVQYDAEGRRMLTTDRAGHSTGYVYDEAGHLLQTTNPDGSFSQNVLNAAGRPITSIQGGVPGSMVPSSAQMLARYIYDAAGRVIASTNAFGESTSYAYDENGNQTNVVDGLGHATGFQFDALNRQIGVSFADSTSETYGYDARDRKIAVTNQASVITRFGFDALNRLVTVTNAFGSPQQAITRYVYDEVGNLLQQIDALSHTNKFEYDALGRRTKQTLPGNQVAIAVYDAIGNQTRFTNFNNVVITNQFDALDRLTNRVSGGGYAISFAYSASGLRTNMVDASGTTSYTYDSSDRILTKATPQGTLTYGYDQFGNMASLQSSTTSGTKINYYYDALNRLTNLVDRFTNSTTYAYDAAGNLQSGVYQNGVTNSYAYDALNRLTNSAIKSSGGTLASFSYKLEQAGNRTNLIEALNSVNRTNTWKFDNLYRLTNEVIGASSGPTGAVTNTLDLAGNRTARNSTVTGVSTTTWAVNSNDQITADSYDANGNPTNSASITFKYDAENHLTNYNNGAATYVYDGDGNRVRKIAGGVTTYYLIDEHNPTGYPQVVEELTTVGSTSDRLYTYGLSLISQRQSGGTTSFYGCDGGGNVRLLTASNGTISDTYVYDANGIAIASTGSTPNNLRFAGEYYDSTLGMYYLRSRLMNPNTGRFWTRDSFEGNQENPISLHKYLYAYANPVNNIDPSGMDAGGVLDSLSVITLFGAAQGGGTTIQQRARQVVAQASGSRPGSGRFWQAYKKVNYDTYPPSQNIKVWQTVGGNVGAFFGPKQENSCATRVSYGLNYSGAEIPLAAQTAFGAWKNKTTETYAGKNGDGKNYIPSAAKMESYLKQSWGKPDATIASVTSLTAFIRSLGDNQCAIFATGGETGHGHSGVLKIGYKDPYVEVELPVSVWILPISP